MPDEGFVPIEEANQFEANVPPYTLPDPLCFASGGTVDSPKDWWERRRPEILRLFEEHIYGRTPGRPETLQFQVRSVQPQVLSGRATRKEI